MTLNKIKFLAIAIFIFPLILAATFDRSTSAATAALGDDEAAIYKAKCAMCHGQKAEKAFDVALTDDEMVKAILDGKKGEKPPYMPAFKEKGIDEEKAKALVAHMRQLRPAAE